MDKLSIDRRSLSRDSHPDAQSDANSPGTRTWRVLVAEDVPSLQRLLVLMLQKAGHAVTAADNGLQAVEMARREAFDAILMDIQMPGMNGLDAMRIIREQEAQTGEHAAIVAITAHTILGDSGMCLAAGADAYRPKPVDLDELMSLLEKLIQAPPDAPAH